MRRDATLEEVFVCLKSGGKAWWCENGIGIGDNGETLYITATHAVLVFKQCYLTGWQIEDKDVGYVDIVPVLYDGIWCIKGEGRLTMSISEVISDEKFMGYVWENSSCKKHLNNAHTLWRHSDDSLYDYHVEESTLERCKSVRFKT